MRLTGPVAIRLTYAACLLGATFNHAQIILQHGQGYDYGGVAGATRLFWTGLTVADPLAVVLLLVCPRWGVIATAVIITADVAHNAWFRLAHPGGFDLMLAEQVVFLLFVAATLPVALRIRRPDAG